MMHGRKGMEEWVDVFVGALIIIVAFIMLIVPFGANSLYQSSLSKEEVSGVRAQYTMLHFLDRDSNGIKTSELVIGAKDDLLLKDMLDREARSYFNPYLGRNWMLVVRYPDGKELKVISGGMSSSKEYAKAYLPGEGGVTTIYILAAKKDAQETSWGRGFQ